MATIVREPAAPAGPPPSTPPPSPPHAARPSDPTPDTPFSMRAILAPLFAIVLGTFMAILDTTVVNVALPTLGRVFQTDLRVLQWVITGYMLAQAAVIPLAGWFSDRFGAKRIYITALVLFTLGSALCAAAPSAGALVLFRVLQGLGGGMLMPVGMSFLYRLAPPDKRGAVMGAFGVPMLLAPALGPILSGWFLEFADWRLIFLINIPVGIAAVFAAARGLPQMLAQRAAGALDTFGIILGPLGFAALSYGIGESTGAGWTGVTTLAGIGVGLVALALFIARELTFAHPLLELRVFKSRDFSLAIITQWLLMAAIFGSFFLIPVFLQTVRGYGPFETGLATLPQALTAAIFMPIGGRLFDRFGARPLVVPGLILTVIGMWHFSQISATTTAADLRLPLMLNGAGMGLMMMALSTHILNAAPRHLVSRVTSLSGALQNVVSSLAIASYATYLQARITAGMGALMTSGALGGAPGAPGGPAAGRPPTIGAEGAPAAGALGSGGQLPPPVAEVFANAFGDVYGVAMIVAGIAILFALTLRRRAAAPHQPNREAPAPELVAAG